MSAGIIAGKAVLITGASRGIGAATARVAHREGADVVAHYGANTAAAQRLSDDFGGERIHLVTGDLMDPVCTRGVWERAVEAVGRIDVLVNNAGAWIASPLTDDGWAGGWRDNLALNLQAPADLCRYAIGHFRGLSSGAIVNVASRSSHRGDDAEHLADGAAKGGWSR